MSILTKTNIGQLVEIAADIIFWSIWILVPFTERLPYSDLQPS